jgi:hypothetical protein
MLRERELRIRQLQSICMGVVRFGVPKACTVLVLIKLPCRLGLCGGDIGIIYTLLMWYWSIPLFCTLLIIIIIIIIIDIIAISCSVSSFMYLIMSYYVAQLFLIVGCNWPFSAVPSAMNRINALHLIESSSSSSSSPYAFLFSYGLLLMRNLVNSVMNLPTA